MTVLSTAASLKPRKLNFGMFSHENQDFLEINLSVTCLEILDVRLCQSKIFFEILPA